MRVMVDQDHHGDHALHDCKQTSNLLVIVDKNQSN